MEEFDLRAIERAFLRHVWFPVVRIDDLRREGVVRARIPVLAGLVLAAPLFAAAPAHAEEYDRIPSLRIRLGHLPGA